LRGEFDELLRIPLEVAETVAPGEDAVDAAPRELCAVLELGEKIGKIDIGFVQDDRCRSGGLDRLNTCLDRKSVV